MNDNRFEIIKKAILVTISLIYLVPLYVAAVNAFKPYDDIIKSPLALPYNFTLNN